MDQDAQMRLEGPSFNIIQQAILSKEPLILPVQDRSSLAPKALLSRLSLRWELRHLAKRITVS